MSDDMNADIREAIEKHIPAHLGKVLQGRLALVDGLEANVAQLKGQNEEQRILVNDYKGKSQEVARIELEAERLLENLRKREAEVAKREIAAEVVEVRIKAADDRAKAVFALAEIAFKAVSPGQSRYDLSFSGSMPADQNSYGTQPFSASGTAGKSE